jgi:hypothetical protein
MELRVIFGEGIDRISAKKRIRKDWKGLLMRTGRFERD